MSALTTERLTDFAGTAPARGTYPIAANTRIFKGALVAVDSSGRAIPATIAASGAVKIVGVSGATYDNRNGSALGGAAAACDVEVQFGVFSFATSTIAADDVNTIAYALDDQTVELTDGGGAARRPAGIITEVRDGLAYVWGGAIVAALSGAAL